MHTVVITDSDLPGDTGELALRSAGLEVLRPDTSDPNGIIRAAQAACALVVQWAPITAEMMDSMPQLRIISRLGIGYDMIDVAAATERGIAVANTPAYCIEEVSAHTVALIFDLVRGVSAYDRSVRRHEWSATAATLTPRRLSTLTVGVVGYGRIGQQVARACAALGFSVLVSDPFAQAARVSSDGYRLCGLGELLGASDVVTLHAPLTAETRHLVNADSIQRMRPGALLVNTCRGGLIDQSALAVALRAGHIGAAALDVFDEEPLSEESPLRDLANVTLTPHAAWFSPESLEDLPIHAAHNVIDFLAGREVPAIVNKSVLSVPAASDR
jgi:phosphoglycerate dehydrogenase-like enzyme